MESTVKLRIHGKRDDTDLKAERGGGVGPGSDSHVTGLLDVFKVVDSFNLSPAARDATEAVEDDYRDDDLLEFEVDGGFTTWISAKRYAENVSLLRGRESGETVTVDTVPQVSERGVSEWVANRLRIWRLDVTDNLKETAKNPSQWPRSLEDVKNWVEGLGRDLGLQLPAWLVTKALIHLIENNLEPGPGLYTWEDATKQPWTEGRSVLTPEGIDADKPILVFVHGMASSTRGSFSGFLGVDAQPQWEALKKLFGGRIYAFEHRTLSDSPIDNAIDLLRSLPARARVNLVSHSRGGLVGDLISLRSIDNDLLERFKRGDKRLENADLYDQKQLKELARLINEKQLRIERFVRCAAPSRGTLLAGENIDLFLSVLTNLVQLIPGVGGTPLYEVTKRIALEIIRSRTEPSEVPGIEAMMPQSQLVALLNNAKARAGGDIGVVAGDISGGNWLKRIGLFASDHIIYEARDNDLVVNTDAMFNGARRVADTTPLPTAGYVFDQGADVNHFSYFRNTRTRGAVIDWLSGRPGERPTGFSPIPTETFLPVPMLRAEQTRDGADQPVVFVVPDIMGSHLKAGGRTVWPSYDALLEGGMSELSDIGGSSVAASDLVGVGYRELCEHLKQAHTVIPFAYDWRKSIAVSAEALASEVKTKLDDTKQPIRFIAHGVGGLVVRAMIASHAGLWDDICAREGARLLMLGTPNSGSFDAVETLLGTYPAIQQLALLDPDNDAGKIAAIFAQFPGVLELLPKEYFDQDEWKRQFSGSVVPDKDRLDSARRTIEAIAPHVAALIPHADRVVAVFGVAPRTVNDITMIDGRVVLSVTPEGDGRVTYASCRLPGVATWYVEATHGDLASHVPSFSAFTELLQRGATARLATASPSTVIRGAPVEFRALPERALYPTESSLAPGLLGMQPRQPYLPQSLPGFRVKVVHGDLRYASYPVVVGHYEGDTIVGAEAEVDKRLGGALSQRYSLGLYPGQFGSIAVILRKPTVVQEALHMSSGAVVMGLGKWGDLGAQQLSYLVRHAALHYVLQLCDSVGPSGDDSTAAPKVGLSVLLVGGASTTNITVADSVGAILRAIAETNRELATGNCRAMTIQDLEIIELYADRATEAAHAVNHLAPLIGGEVETNIQAEPLLVLGRAGRERLRLSTERTAWRRWEVSVVTPARSLTPPRLAKPLLDRLKRAVLESENADVELLKALTELAFCEAPEPEVHREIRYLTLSERARAEANTQQRQPELVERLIKTAISQTRFLPEESRVLFELMVPNDLKSSLAQVDNLVLVVDAETAAYPWELLSAGDKPLFIAKGLVRQLQTSNYRPQIGTRAGKEAYVVGDPKVSAPFQQLPGAAEEAKSVYELLRTKFKVEEPLSKPTALEVLAGLYQKPYRIVHLAGHGYYQSPTTADGKARSGLVLDNGIYLTAVEVKQMQQVPELVFLNCCHIGQTGPEDAGSVAPGSPVVEFNRLAASVSRELIEMGVRAVVAAGWAVRDDAAKDFAETFYRGMLDGDTFGRALRAAREHTHGRFPLVNTWGAYQAYGDPDYQLEPMDTDDAGTADRRVAVAEFIQAVKDIAATAERGGESKSAEAGRKLDDLYNSCPPGWREQTDVQIRLGIAYGSLGRYMEACKYLKSALAGEAGESTTTFFAVEQLANFEARIANEKVVEAQRLATTDPEAAQRSRVEAQEFHDSAVKRLEHLLAVAPTAERYSLLGGTYRRRAMAVKKDAEKTRDALEKATQNYRQAHVLNDGRRRLDPYPTLNWLTWATVLRQHIRGADELLARCEATAGERFMADRKFYTAVGMADARLTRVLLQKRLNQKGPAADRELDELHEKYRQVFEQSGPTESEIQSSSGQIDAIADLLEALKTEDRATETDMVVANLKRLRTMIAGETPATPDSQDDGPKTTP